MTDFFDVLEAQLGEAAQRRPRRALPRRPGLEMLVASAVVAAGVALVLAMTGSSAVHRSPVPAAPGSALGDRGRAVSIVVLNASGVPGRADDLARKLTAEGAHVDRVGTASIHDLPDTDVMYALGQGGAALDVSEAITGIPPRLAAFRVAPLDAATASDAGQRAQVVVRVGRDDVVVPPTTSAVEFRNGCPGADARVLSAGDIHGAVNSVLQAWSAADRAVVASAHLAANSDRGPQVVGACGADFAQRTVVIELDLTAWERSANPSEAVLFVSCDGHDHWRVWKRAH